MVRAGDDKVVNRTIDQAQRQVWLAALVHASADALVSFAKAYSHIWVDDLRPPQTGLVMLRSRIGGSGDRFNLAEATVTRCVVRCAGDPEPTVGVGYVLGRDIERCRAMALFDALLQQPAHHDLVWREVVGPLAARTAQQRAKAAADTARSRVRFSTLQPEAPAP
jgi:alpha-D-ribose 1-methylphosphonate 5-triphosphate synthase subunit PhnG